MEKEDLFEYKTPCTKVITFENKSFFMEASPSGDAEADIPGQNED